MLCLHISLNFDNSNFFDHNSIAIDMRHKLGSNQKEISNHAPGESSYI